MLDDASDILGAAQQEDAFAVLKDLENNTPDEIRRRRAHFRLSVKAAVILQSGNASQLMAFKVKGVTGDISQGGCSVLLPIPVAVGDIYRMQFDRKTLDLPLTFARCVRCRLVREDAYEAGLAFFAPIELPEQAVQSESSLLA
jgi:c-di-GMP-binding flagellar brake protein YcgR